MSSRFVEIGFVFPVISQLPFNKNHFMLIDSPVFFYDSSRKLVTACHLEAFLPSLPSNEIAAYFPTLLQTFSFFGPRVTSLFPDCKQVRFLAPELSLFPLLPFFPFLMCNKCCFRRCFPFFPYELHVALMVVTGFPFFVLITHSGKRSSDSIQNGLQSAALPFPSPPRKSYLRR